jgi:hypothetical protein
LRHTLQPRGNINPVSHQVAIALFDYIAEMNADAKLDPTFRAQTGIAFNRLTLAGWCFALRRARRRRRRQRIERPGPVGKQPELDRRGAGRAFAGPSRQRSTNTRRSLSSGRALRALLDRRWSGRILRLQPKSAFSRFPPVHRADL